MSDEDEDGVNEAQNREKVKHQMVRVMHSKNKESGKFETIDEIFSRLPMPRLEKSGYKFLFDNLRENVEVILKQEDYLAKLKLGEKQATDAIKVKLGKIAPIPHEELTKETLSSRKPLFRSVVYLRNQKDFGFREHAGEIKPFMSDSRSIDLDKIPNEIPNLRLFLEDEGKLKRYEVEFVNENEIIFQNKSFPSSKEIKTRAEALAKLYLLDLYREESRKLITLDRQDETDLEKKRQINKIKQDMEKEKLKEGELIEDMDLMKQVIKILDLIEKKMNACAYEEFKNKNGERAFQIKKSLEKLKSTINSETLPKTKLKILVSYKHKKGW